MPIKPSDYSKTRDMLSKHYKLFTDNVMINEGAPIFVEINGKMDEQVKQQIKELENKHLNNPIFIDSIGKFED